MKMNNNLNQYLNEEKYQKTKRVLITIGFISLCIGLTLIIISFVMKTPEMGQDGWYDANSRKMILRFLGFIFCLMIPMPMFFMAFRRNIIAYNVQQMMPVAKEGIKEMTPAYKEMAKEMAPIYGEIAKEISKGVSEGIKDSKE